LTGGVVTLLPHFSSVRSLQAGLIRESRLVADEQDNVISTTC
jgi:hypothetical protein